MSKFNENYSKAIKNFIISEYGKPFSLKETLDEEIQKITNGKNLECSALEAFDEENFYKSVYISKCHNIIDSISIPLLKNEFQERILNFNDNSSDCLMNIGVRASLDENKKIIFEEWRNVINKADKNIILLSVHRIYSEKKYEIKLSYNFCTYSIIILLNDSEDIYNIKYVEYKGPITIFYSCYKDNKNALITSLIYENKEEKNSEIVNEKMYYSKNDINKSDDGDLNITINKVETETLKKEDNFDYSEKNYEIYYIDPISKKKWGNKKYENNKNRKYTEEWVETLLGDNGYEEKYHKYLDDGCGKQTTEDHGKKVINENEIDYEYTDTYIYDVPTGDETTTKIGFDRYNKWNCYNYRNRIKNFSHVNNEASNSKDKMEWKEKWDEEGNEKSCTKWGKSEDEEWEESWKEIYDNQNDNSEKICYKKCKKLKEDKEWFETWTEKNNGKPNCEKTCYKMNREGGNKYENYWGSIIVNYLDNKRMNYVGYINNNNKEEYVNYTYENNNN